MRYLMNNCNKKTLPLALSKRDYSGCTSRKEFRMKKIAILGGGESGTGAALLAQAKGLAVFVSDIGKISAPYKEVLLAHGIAFEEDGHTQARILAADEVVKSPGIPNSAPIVLAIQQAKLPIVDEIEFASRYTKAFLIGITGTNGKTTTAHLTYHLLKKGGLNVGLAGNVGASFAKMVLEETHDYYVLELSNFQLEGMHQCQLAIGCLLNITPDHLDRYQGKMEAYAQAKFRLLQNMTAQEHFIYNQDDPNIRGYLQKHDLPPCQHPLSAQQPSAGAEDTLRLLATSSFQLQGAHNAFNARVAITVAQLLGVNEKTIQTGLGTFTGVPHRLAWVGEIGGVHFYKDSKATNVAAAYVALESFTQPIIWVAGGYNKGNDYSAILPLAKKQVKAMICLGKDNSAIIQAMQGAIKPIHETQSMERVVAIALSLAQPGDVVLLAPACASFDLFKNFAERGVCFEQAVLQAKRAPKPPKTS